MEICSVCKKEFKNETEYLNHRCQTGFTPSQIEHQITLDPNYEKISQEALKRGNTK